MFHLGCGDAHELVMTLYFSKNQRGIDLGFDFAYAALALRFCVSCLRRVPILTPRSCALRKAEFAGVGLATDAFGSQPLGFAPADPSPAACTEGDILPCSVGSGVKFLSEE